MFPDWLLVICLVADDIGKGGSFWVERALEKIGCCERQATAGTVEEMDQGPETPIHSTPRLERTLQTLNVLGQIPALVSSKFQNGIMSSVLVSRQVGIHHFLNA